MAADPDGVETGDNSSAQNVIPEDSVVPVINEILLIGRYAWWDIYNPFFPTPFFTAFRRTGARRARSPGGAHPPRRRRPSPPTRVVGGRDDSPTTSGP